ncbi:hypothetical protein [uncultured Sphingomonas sp.]|uniref:hypothetical protein n=1 Tax=uncultured Sphingomonas sp. TaxID=158754 RepID=UPI0025FB42EF|nr:hypothetical protein [uncultured Sphingomonas sp.]
MIYAIVPANPEIFGVPPWPTFMIAEYVRSALPLAGIVAGVGYLTRTRTSTREPVPVHPILAIIVFVGGCFWLHDYPWVDVREGIEGSISAVFRVFWFVIVLNLRQSDLNWPKRLVYVLATAILMFFDQSRTYFLIALLVLLTNFNWIAIIPAIVSGLMVAAIRSGQNQGFVHSITFAVGGEGYLGSQGVFQVLALPDGGVNFWIPSMQALFAPMTALITVIAKRLDYPVDLFDSSTYLGNYIEALTDQPYPPMGGFFILSEFIRAGWFGMICIALYMTIAFVVTKRLFDTAEFPIGSFIAILSIKSSPATYWNMVLVVFVVSYIFRQVGKIVRSAEHVPLTDKSEITA